MRDDHHRDAGIGKLTQEKQHFLDDLGIERGCRLIEKHQLRPHGKRACNGDALLLPARKPGGKHMGLVAQAETLQQSERLCFRFRPGAFLHLDRAFHDVFQNAQMGPQIKLLEHETHFRAHEVDFMMRLHAHRSVRLAFAADIFAANFDEAPVRCGEMIDAAQ